MSERADLERLLSKYGIPAASDRAHRFRAYFELLQKWNRRINLVGSTSWSVMGPLFEESLWASGFYPKHSVRHLDIGSGAGFPALPMRIVHGSMILDLVESRSKRTAFLETAVDSLGLAGTRVFNCRLSDFLKMEGASEKWDCYSWKGIRLNRGSLSSLVRSAGVGAQFWMFHGCELPIEGGEPDPSLLLSRREDLPHKPSWHLSIFKKAHSALSAPPR